MPAELAEKVDRYERLLAEALEAAEPAPVAEAPLEDAAEEVAVMARSYLDDGRHFAAEDDPVNALAAFAYGHGWLDAGVRLGLFSVPDGGHAFAV
ncbi:MAG: DUF357 domain-containing protein [Halobacteriales archaeon]